MNYFLLFVNYCGGLHFTTTAFLYFSVGQLWSMKDAVSRETITLKGENIDMVELAWIV